jgi:beta-lactam-binding protein with PASTA domain
MAKTFAITTIATDTVKADATGHTEAVFTVTNTASRPIRGLAKVKALGDSKKEWLSIAGETERDFGSGATEQFTVNFDAPGAPAGKYSFRLDVASSLNPDEDFTEGPPVNVEVGGAAPVAAKKGFPMWIIPVIAVGLLLVIGLVVWLLWPKPKQEAYVLPDVTNSSEQDARQLLETGCTQGNDCVAVEVKKVSDKTIAKDMAISTDPVAGTEVPLGSTVMLNVSSGAEGGDEGDGRGKVTLLNVVNQPAAQAKETLEKSCSPSPCLDVETNRVPDNTVKVGTVIRTVPGPGTQVRIGSKVTMDVSAGTDEVQIPDVHNQPEAQARKLLEGACKPSPCLKVVKKEQTSDLADGRAINTDPGRGSVKIGSTIVLIVSTGPELKAVGQYVGLPEQVARQRIVADGFTVGKVTRVRAGLPGLVSDQNPNAQVKRVKGSKIDLSVFGGG